MVRDNGLQLAAVLLTVCPSSSAWGCWGQRSGQHLAGGTGDALRSAVSVAVRGGSLCPAAMGGSRTLPFPVKSRMQTGLKPVDFQQRQ